MTGRVLQVLDVLVALAIQVLVVEMVVMVTDQVLVAALAAMVGLVLVAVMAIHLVEWEVVMMNLDLAVLVLLVDKVLGVGHLVAVLGLVALAILVIQVQDVLEDLGILQQGGLVDLGVLADLGTLLAVVVDLIPVDLEILHQENLALLEMLVVLAMLFPRGQVQVVLEVLVMIVLKMMPDKEENLFDCRKVSFL